MEKSLANDSGMIENLNFTKALAVRSKTALLSGNCHQLGELMHEHWEHKKSRSFGITNDFVESVYEKAMRSGAVGGKLVGAGGGGFLMFYANDVEKLRHEMAAIGLEEVRFKFDFEGTKVVLT